MTGVERIAAERKRQIEAEGWTAEHDAAHETPEALAVAAGCYACPPWAREMHERPVWEWSGGARHPDTYLRPSGRTVTVPVLWPWDAEWWKPTPGNRIRELEKAGALIAAEIDRLLGDKEEHDE